MEIRKGDFAPGPAAHLHARRLPTYFFLFSIFILYSCAAPGEPIERKPPTPTPVTDLTASQSGNDVILTFTLPRDSVEKREILKPLSVNVYRNFELVPLANSPAVAASSPANPTLLLTIPPSMVDRYTVQGRVRFVDSLRAEDFAPTGREALYLVRTFVSPKKLSANSDVAALAVYPPANPIADLRAEFTRAGVTLSWTQPEKTIIGTATNIVLYRVYRAEMEPGANSGANPPAAASNTEAANPKVPFARIAEPVSPPYTDTQTELGKTYAYSVRSVAQFPGVQLESVDSTFATITPTDVFPPPAPRDLVVAFVPAVAGMPAYLDLSWSTNAATDIAGYNVYRSEEPSRPGTRLNSELLLTPSFRDMNAVLGHTYFYTVTAVDRSGNESPASTPASGSVPAPDR